MSGFHKSPSRLRYLVCSYRNDDVANLLEDHDYEPAVGDMPKHAASACVHRMTTSALKGRSHCENFPTLR